MWDWSPVLPAPLLDGCGPLLAALRRLRPAGPPDPRAAEDAGADQALFDLLTVVWRTGADLADNLTSALDHLHALAEPLTRPAGPPPAPGPDTAAPALDDGPAAGGEYDAAGGLLGSDPAVRALGCLLEYATARARRGTAVPDDVLGLVAGVLAARAGDEAVATAIGVRLPLLHRHAADFTAAHPELYDLIPGRATPAAAWLRWGGHDPLLLTALGPGRLLHAVRANLPGADRHLAHAVLTGTDDLLGEARPPGRSWPPAPTERPRYPGSWPRSPRAPRAGRKAATPRWSRPPAPRWLRQHGGGPRLR